MPVTVMRLQLDSPTLTQLLPLKGKTLAPMEQAEGGVGVQGFRIARTQLVLPYVLKH